MVCARRESLVVLFLFVALTGVNGQQLADDRADIAVRNPEFQRNAGPTVAIDAGHHNYHTAGGRYRPFANLLRNDGLKVSDFSGTFSARALRETRLLVVANALPVSAPAIRDWNSIQPSAFSPEEVHAVVQWVRQGGSLLLIADHRPFAGSAQALARAFGFEFADALARREPQTGAPDIFTTASGTLKDDEILAGRDKDERVTSVETFAGSAFRVPLGAEPVIVLPQNFSLFSCGLPCPPGTTKKPATGYDQGSVARIGRGKVAIFGEAAMFTAQAVQSGGQTYYAGFNSPTAMQNKQFILNLVRWLVLPSKEDRR